MAHAIAGLTVLEVARGRTGATLGGRRFAFAFPAVAMLPDVDSVLGAISPEAFDFLSLPGGYPIHRGVTHSLAFAVASGLVAAVVCFPRTPRSWLRAWPWLAFAAATHPLLDSLMGRGAPIPFFWPLSSARFRSPYQLVPVAFFSHTLGGLVGLIWNPMVWALFLHEATVFLPLWFLARRWRLVRHPDALPPLPAAAGAIIAGSAALAALACMILHLEPVDGTFHVLETAAWLAIAALTYVLMAGALRGPRAGRLGTFGPLPVALALATTALAIWLV